MNWDVQLLRRTSALPGPLPNSELDPGVVTLDPGMLILGAEEDDDLALSLLLFLS